MMLRIVLLLLLLTDPPRPSPQSQPATRDVPATQGDPTRASSALRSFMAPAGANQPPNPTPRIHGFTRRGYVEADDQPALAVYEVEDCGLVTLQPGATLTITSRAGDSTTVLVKRLTVDELVIELPETGKTIVFH